MIFNDKKIPYLLMTESQRTELMKQNSEIYFKGYMSSHMHLCEKTTAGMTKLISEMGESEGRKVLITLQQLDECLGIQEAMVSVVGDTKSAYLRSYTDKILSSIQILEDIGQIEKHESYLIEHIEKMNLLC